MLNCQIRCSNTYPNNLGHPTFRKHPPNHLWVFTLNHEPNDISTDSLFKGSGHEMTNSDNWFIMHFCIHLCLVDETVPHGRRHIYLYVWWLSGVARSWDIGIHDFDLDLPNCSGTFEDCTNSFKPITSYYILFTQFGTNGLFNSI